MDNDFVLDYGNALCKWYSPQLGSYGDFRSVVAELSTGDLRALAGRSSVLPDGVVKVNGTGYAVGDAARRYVITERPRGAARYRQENYGVGLVFALSRCFSTPRHTVTLFASHAPQDISYAPILMTTAQQQWEIESKNGAQTFTVSQVHTFDEPLGGYSHFAFTKEGKARQRNRFTSHTVLVVDVGGYTTDVIAVDPGGEIDLMSAHSTRTGVLDVLERFEAALRTNNRTLFQDTGEIDARRLEYALIGGKYQFGKVVVKCKDEARQCMTELVNDVIQVINAAGGAANYDMILLTGGGSALIHDTLCASYNRAEFVLAEKDLSLLKYANVFGGGKIAALLRRLDVL